MYRTKIRAPRCYQRPSFWKIAALVLVMFRSHCYIVFKWEITELGFSGIELELSIVSRKQQRKKHGLAKKVMNICKYP